VTTVQGFALQAAPNRKILCRWPGQLGYAFNYRRRMVGATGFEPAPPERAPATRPAPIEPRGQEGDSGSGRSDFAFEESANPKNERDGSGHLSEIRVKKRGAAEAAPLGSGPQGFPG
jgi:hypothetical protein